MPFMQAVTDAIANPKQVRLSQERASARTYSHLEPKMKGIRDTSPECMPGVHGTATHRTDSTFSSRPSSITSSKTPSRAPSKDRSVRKPSSSSATPPPRPSARPVAQLLRSYSEAPIQNKPEFTPDITATSLTAEQIKRNYSCDGLTARWDPSKDPLPPMNPMHGFGRYRVSANADAEFRAQHVRRQTREIEYLPGMTANLDMQAMTGLSNQDWQHLTCGGSRRGSGVSSLGTMTDSSSSPLELSNRVAHGFSPSGSSSKSSQTAYSHRRKGSTLSMMLPVDSSPPPVAIMLKRTSTIHSERRGSGLLSTIEELHTNPAIFAEARRKVEKPCEFSDEGDLDSAVVSDVEGDEGWTDVVETNPSKVSAITQMIKEGKIQQQPPQPALTRVRTFSGDKKRVRSTTTLDRSKTIRATRPEANRRQSKTKSSHESNREQKKKDKSAEGQSAENTDKSPPGLEIQIVNPSKAQIKHRPSKELVIDQILKNTAIGDKKTTTQHPQAARNRSTTAIFRANPKIGQNNGQTQLAYVAK